MTTPGTYLHLHSFADPYVLKCGHTFEKEKALHVHRCPTCKIKVEPEEASPNESLAKTQKTALDIITGYQATEVEHKEIVFYTIDKLRQQERRASDGEKRIEEEQSLRRLAERRVEEEESLRKLEERRNLHLDSELRNIIASHAREAEQVKTPSVLLTGDATHIQPLASPSADGEASRETVEAKLWNAKKSAMYGVSAAVTGQAAILWLVKSAAAASIPFSPITAIGIALGLITVTLSGLDGALEMYALNDAEIERTNGRKDQ